MTAWEPPWMSLFWTENRNLHHSSTSFGNCKHSSLFLSAPGCGFLPVFKFVHKRSGSTSICSFTFKTMNTVYPDVFNYIHPEFQISLDIMTHRCFWILFCHLWYSWKHQAIHHAVSLELNNSVFDISVFSGHSFSMDFTNSLRMVFTAASVCSQQLLSEFHWLMQHLKVLLKDCQKGQA